MCGSATTAAATSAETRRAVAGSCWPRLTQCEAVTLPPIPVRAVSAASSRSDSTAGSVVSSVCRSTSLPCSRAATRYSRIACAGSGST